VKVVYRLGGVVVILVALLFLVGGLATLWGDGRMDTWGKVMIGLAFAALGVVTAMGGLQLLRRSRSRG
jgi:hypothetical protein